ncbi:MAG: putative nucleotide-diphospho-sugar transferase [Gammaproteobacteria bacterium]|jgi:hypothetical protein
MKFVTAAFDYPGRDTYKRCLDALVNSIRVNAPYTSFHIIDLEPPDEVPGVFQGWINNHIKLEAYSQVAIDEPTIFVDADTVVLRDPSDLFDGTFDIGIGERPTGHRVKSRFNGGVVLFDDTDRAREFMRQWIRTDSEMLTDSEFHKKWHKTYRGQNQSSFGYLYEERREIARIKEFPTGTVNACEQDWPRLGKIRPYIVHVRKQLLRAAQSNCPISRMGRNHREGARLWREYEKCDR